MSRFHITVTRKRPLPLDPQIKPFAVKLPFSPAVIRLSRRPQALLLSLTKVPGAVERLEYAGAVPLHIVEPPELPQDAPCLLFIHGGGFGYSAAPHHKITAAKLALGVGCRVICPAYRLLPEHPYPACREDVFAAYRWLCRTYPNSPTAIGGDSAGGMLTIYCVLDACKEQLTPPRLQMLIYPATDVTMSSPSMQTYTDTPLWNARNNAAMWKMLFQDQPLEEISPMQMPLPHPIPPTFMEVAEFDCLRDEGFAYAQRLTKAGGQVELHFAAHEPHGYDIAQHSDTVRQLLSHRISALKKAFYP